MFVFDGHVICLKMKCYFSANETSKAGYSVLICLGKTTHNGSLINEIKPVI